jgi:YD repeat-containing protein
MPNPEPAKIASYGKYEISNFTGKPNISIPLYSVKTPRLEVPISLVYEATGVKVNEIASNVGLGFILNCGGVITRAIIGLPDDYTRGYLTYTANPNDFSNRNYLYDLNYNQNYDLEPDKYFYNFNGISGEFSFDEQKKVFNMEMNGLLINRTIDGFKIIDENGNIYEFTEKEFTTLEVDLAIAQPNSITSWWLTKITSADRSDSINFEYETDLEEQEQLPSFIETYGIGVFYREGEQGSYYEGKMYTTESPVVETASSFQKRSWSAKRISSIKFKNGKVDFININDRQDVINSTRLDKIEVYAKGNAGYSKIKTLKLIPDYFHYTGPVEFYSIFYSTTAGRHRLKLLAVEEYGSNDAFVSKYSFDYDMSSEIPYRGSLVADYWGYNNAAYINNREVTLIPAQRTDDNKYSIGGANRDPNEQAMKAGILTKITYPTGGHSKFSWSAHRYLHSNQTVQTWPAYCKVNGNNSTNTPQPLKTVKFEITEGQDVFIFSSIRYTEGNDPYTDPELSALAQDIHPYVNIVNDVTGSVVFSYSDNSLNINTTRQLVPGKYTITAACYVNNITAYAEIEVKYTKTANIPDIRLAGGLRIDAIENFSSDGKMSSKGVYKYGTSESGYGSLSMPTFMMNTLSYNKPFCYVLNFSKINSLKRVYRSEPVASINLSGGSSVVYPVVTKYLGDNENNVGKTVFRYNSQSDATLTPYPSGTNEEFVVTRHPWRTGNLTDQEDYKNEGATYKLVKHAHNEYTELGFEHFQVPKSGFKANPIPIIGGMGAEAALFFLEDYYYTSYPIVRGINQLTSTRIDEYGPVGLPLTTTTTYTYEAIYKKFVTSQNSRNSSGEEVKVFYKYPFDKDQIVELNSANKGALSKMMRKNIIAPIVETQTFKNNTSIERIRTNFQILDISQNSSDSIIRPQNVQRQILASPTEIVYRQLKYDSYGNIQEQARDSDISSVYLWGYGSSHPLAEIKNSTLPNVLSAMGLTQSQLESNTMTTIPSTDYLSRINNLRNSLPNALITTYTYKPLVGITSATAANGNTIYYEYDTAGRLQYIRDKDNNIVRTYEYNYQIK